MKVRVVPALELGKEHLELWERLQAANPTLLSPYFCYQFTRTVASVRNDVWVGVIEEEERIRGFFPFQRGRMGMGRPVGGSLSDFHGVIADPAVDWDARELISKCGLSLWDFNHLSTSMQSFAPYHTTVSDSPYMDLSGGYEVYAVARRQSGSEQIKKTANLRRKLEREVGPLRFELHCPDPKVLETLLNWKSRQYIESGTVDLFCVAWIVSLLQKLMDERSRSFAGLLTALWAGDRFIAGHFGMRSQQVWHYWFPSYDVEYSKYSPGLILLLKMAENAESAGLRVIDLGKGDTLYKQRLANGVTRVAEGCVAVPSMALVLRRTGQKLQRWMRNTPAKHIARKVSWKIEKRMRLA